MKREKTYDVIGIFASVLILGGFYIIGTHNIYIALGTATMSLGIVLHDALSDVRKELKNQSTN